ncbi:MAG: hypothetical protein K0R54_4791 [Clostridiaceae bacterium]|nr:hypothetical protein [Clostridiaceae bacterium]
MNDKTISLFLSNMINSTYKVLVMKDVEDSNLQIYLDSLCIQLLGGLETFSELKSNQKYISVVNIIQYLRINDFDKKTCKREILKSTNILDKLSKQLGGE